MLKAISTSLLILVLACKAFAANNKEVKIAFDPIELALGQHGLLNITVSGTQNAPEPTIPMIDGLTIQPLGSRINFQMFNGKTSASFTLSYTVTPQKIGEFSLPNFDWQINGKKYPVPASTAKLKVVPQGTSSTYQDSPSLELKVDVEAEKDKVFVGQMLPVKIQLIAPVNFPGQIKSAPTTEGNDFINHGYKNELVVNIESIDDVNKQVATFNTYLTPSKSGDLTLQYKMGLIVQKPRTMPQNRMGSSFFDNIFGASIIPVIEEVDLTSTPEKITVAPLPIHGKPQNFTGAIGDFTIESFSTSSQKVQVGDPITLTLAIKGTGNFERISPPVLNIGENWKSYTPKSTLDKKDIFGFTGTKVFEYIVIPQNDKITETPAISFPFFNPQTGLYSEVTPDPIALQISPAPESSLGNPRSPSNTQTSSQSTSSEPELLPIKLEINKSVKNLSPLMTKPYFMPSLLGIALLTAGLLTLIKKQILRRKEDAAFLKRINTERAIQTNLQKVKQAHSKQNAKEFYHSATAVLLEIVAQEHPKSSQALQTEDVLNYFKEKHLSEGSISYINTLFLTADQLKFSGIESNEKISSENLTQFESLIKEIEKCC